MRETGIRTNEIGLKIETGIANYWYQILIGKYFHQLLIELFFDPIYFPIFNCQALQKGVVKPACPSVFLETHVRSYSLDSRRIPF